MTIFIDTVMNPQFIATSLAAICVFATVLTIALPMLQRDQMSRRMREMAIERSKMRSARIAELSSKERQQNQGGGRLRSARSKGYMRRVVDQFNLRDRFDNEELRENLKRAGLRGEANIVAFLFFRVVAPIGLFFFSLFYVFFVYQSDYSPMVKLLIAVAVGFLGFYVPNVFISNRVQKRQTAIKQAWPDALDMMLICVQSGMSVEAGFGKVSREIVSQSIELAEEMSLTTAELSYLQDRRQAFENLAKRTGLPGVKAVTTALSQAERYGTPVGTALRTMAKENREIRQSEAERKAAALPPKLTVPMIVFFLPVLFIVILGPAIISYMDVKK
jgi:tight adherence protein C